MDEAIIRYGQLAGIVNRPAFIRGRIAAQFHA